MDNQAQNIAPEDLRIMRTLRQYINNRSYRDFDNTLEALPEQKRYDVLMSKERFSRSVFQETYRSDENIQFFNIAMTKMPANRRGTALLANHRYGNRAIDDIAQSSTRLSVAVNSTPEDQRVALLTSENPQGVTPITTASTEANSLRVIKASLSEDQLKEVLRHRNSRGETACQFDNGAWSRNIQLSALAPDAVSGALSSSETRNIREMANPMKNFLERVGRKDPDSLGDILIDYNRHPETAQGFVDKLNTTRQGRAIGD